MPAYLPASESQLHVDRLGCLVPSPGYPHHLTERDVLALPPFALRAPVTLTGEMGHAVTLTPDGRIWLSDDRISCAVFAISENVTAPYPRFLYC